MPIACPKRLPGRAAVGGVRDGEALVRQPVDDRSGEARVVLDHQDPVRHRNSSATATSHNPMSATAVFQHNWPGRGSREREDEADFRKIPFLPRMSC